MKIHNQTVRKIITAQKLTLHETLRVIEDIYTYSLVYSNL